MRICRYLITLVMACCIVAGAASARSRPPQLASLWYDGDLVETKTPYHEPLPWTLRRAKSRWLNERLCAAHLLSDHANDERAVTILLKFAFEDEDTSVRLVASASLHGSRSPAVQAYVESHLAKMKPDRRLTAASELLGRADALSQRLLYRLTADSDLNVRKEAFYMVAKLDTPRPPRERFLLDHLNSTSSWEETDAIMMGLSNMRAYDILPELDTLATQKRVASKSIANDIHMWIDVMRRDQKHPRKRI